MEWQSYNPKWLVELSKEQYPQKRWLHEAMAKCTRCLVESIAYIHFVPGDRANEPGSEWQFERNIHLDSPTEGWLILDILQDNKVGGVEFVDKAHLAD